MTLKNSYKSIKYKKIAPGKAIMGMNEAFWTTLPSIRNTVALYRGVKPYTK